MDNIVDYVNLYLLPQLIEYNFERNKSATFTYQPLSVNQKQNINEMIQTLIKAGKIKPDLKQLEERSGVMLKEEKEPEVSKTEVKKIVQNETKEIMLDENNKKFEKEFSEIMKIKQDLISLYGDK